MDVLSHGLWGYAILYNTPYAYLGILFGVLPDFLPFFVHYFFYHKNFKKFMAVYKKKDYVKAKKVSIPIMKFLYKFLHSIIIFTLILAIVYLFFQEKALMLLPWGLHLLLDIPSHSNKYFGVKFLYPISNYSFDGIPWTSPIMLITNWTLLILFLAWQILL